MSELVLTITDEDDHITEVFQFNHTPLPELTDALATVADFWQGGHLGIRVELADGE